MKSINTKRSFMNNLVIVESPAKAKTIEKYLGSDFKVLSSVGHIRSIAKKVRGGVEPIDVKNGFATIYEIDIEKRRTVAELKKAVKAAKTVWLATDEDREGEAIAWHLCEVLGLDPAKTNRIVFHEITKDAITEAIKNPRTVDMSLVQAQQARQILDRIVGFELSPVVWQKVPGGKSAGRVQSPAVRLLVEREREIAAFTGSAEFKITAEFTAGIDTLKAELPQRFATEPEAKAFLESLIGANS
jgi:DNA topoisomerase-1